MATCFMRQNTEMTIRHRLNVLLAVHKMICITFVGQKVIDRQRSVHSVIPYSDYTYGMFGFSSFPGRSDFLFDLL